jgi:hypothetical protein
MKDYVIGGLFTLGAIMLVLGAYLCLHYSYDIDGVTFYPLKSRVWEVVAFAGFGIGSLGYWLHNHK